MALVVVAIGVIPATFEVFYRGVLFGELARTTSKRVAAASTAFYFALSQGDARGIPTAFVFGLVMAHLRAKTATVVAPLLAVLAFGAVEGIPVLRGRDPRLDITYPERWIIGGAVMAALALIAVGVGVGQKAGEAAEKG